MLGDVDALLSKATFDEKGLLPAIAQDATTGVVRMQAWVTAEAVRATAESGYATFFSRSRNQLWKKGETSGNTLRVRQIRIDCDGDAILYLVDAEGPTCHTGKTSCFFRDGASEDDGPPEAPAAILSRVAAVIAERRASSSEKSYTSSLLQAGWPKILGKITEEAREVVESLPTDDKAHTAHEAADVIFHLLVGLEAASVPLESVFAELRRRFGTSGLTEKASRKPAG
ncbi:MAG TPA: bifunctional phosphoribosyl-AMP cyclohydrolase/phosphoribosyl-ATP diphosphatase HisIE [Polyangia bacterium]|nr:bifunctional phosphoribosyl-AMP cyclohydrolase/phosphoribosyl-ATP diphosphatase HisIE [Polyangia bacterium]